MRVSVSIPQHLADFLNENADLSPSKLLQSKIIEILENRKYKFHELDRQKRMINALQNKLTEATDEITELKRSNRN